MKRALSFKCTAQHLRPIGTLCVILHNVGGSACVCVHGCVFVVCGYRSLFFLVMDSDNQANSIVTYFFLLFPCFCCVSARMQQHRPIVFLLACRHCSRHAHVFIVVYVLCGFNCPRVHISACAIHAGASQEHSFGQRRQTRACALRTHFENLRWFRTRPQPLGRRVYHSQPPMRTSSGRSLSLAFLLSRSLSKQFRKVL